MISFLNNKKKSSFIFLHCRYKQETDANNGKILNMQKIKK